MTKLNRLSADGKIRKEMQQFKESCASPIAGNLTESAYRPVHFFVDTEASNDGRAALEVNQVTVRMTSPAKKGKLRD